MALLICMAIGRTAAVLQRRRDGQLAHKPILSPDRPYKPYKPGKTPREHQVPRSTEFPAGGRLMHGTRYRTAADLHLNAPLQRQLQWWRAGAVAATLVSGCRRSDAAQRKHHHNGAARGAGSLPAGACSALPRVDAVGGAAGRRLARAARRRRRAPLRRAVCRRKSESFDPQPSDTSQTECRIGAKLVSTCSSPLPDGALPRSTRAAAPVVAPPHWHPCPPCRS